MRWKQAPLKLFCTNNIKQRAEVADSIGLIVRVPYPVQIENRGYKESGNYLTLTQTTADPESGIG